MIGTPAWWTNAVVYQLYVRSFADSNGDGIGDLAGIRSRLGYLRDLGVDAIWLNPCYPSPQRDHGYDVSDYFGIEPDYGTLVEFDALVTEARTHGIRILMDVVPNHCSTAHPWFRDAVAAGPGSAERARFFFRDGRGPGGGEPPNNWTAIFGGSAWHRVTEPDGRPGQWYLGIFTPDQPDLDAAHADVANMFDRMLRFWFDRGVEGMRVDAVVHVGKDRTFPDWDGETVSSEPTLRNPHYTHQASGHVLWRRWRALVDDYAREHPGRDPFLVAEAYTPGRVDLLESYVNEAEFHQSFAFDLMMAPWNAAAIGGAIAFHLDHVVARGLWPAWTVNNHDAHRAVTRYGWEQATTTFTGDLLHRSTQPVDLALGTRRARAMALLQLALPGSVYLYAGEELGLPEVLDIPAAARQDPVFHRTDGREPGRDGCRVPLPWTSDPTTSYGFSAGASHPAAPWMWQPAGWGAWAADAQDGDADSMLELHRNALAVRRAHRAWATDPCSLTVEADGQIVVLERATLVSVTNCGSSPRPIGTPAVGRRILLCSVPGHDDPAVVPPESTVWLA